MNGWNDEWMNGWNDEWMNRVISGWMEWWWVDGCNNESINKWNDEEWMKWWWGVDRWNNELKDGWNEELMDIWNVDEWMEWWWVDECLFVVNRIVKKRDSTCAGIGCSIGFLNPTMNGQIY